MLSHFTEQCDSKYIFKGVSCSKDDCHREESKKNKKEAPAFPYQEAAVPQLGPPLEGRL